MKIVIAVHHFPPRYSSGAELQAYRMAAWMRDHGHDVHVVCIESIDRRRGNGLTDRDDAYDGLPVRRLSYNLADAPVRFRWMYDNPWIGEHLHGYLAELEPDLLHLVSGYLMSGSTLRAAMDVRRADGGRIPTVVTIIDFCFLCPCITLLCSNGQLCSLPFDSVTRACCLGEGKRRYRVLERLAPRVMHAFWGRRSGSVAKVQERIRFLQETLNRVDATIGNSRFLRDMFDQTGFVVERIVFVRQGLDLPHLPPEALEKTPGAHLRIGYMGQIAPHKGVHTLFEAIQRLPGIELEAKAYGDTVRVPRYARSALTDIRRSPFFLRQAIIGSGPHGNDCIGPTGVEPTAGCGPRATIYLGIVPLGVVDKREVHLLRHMLSRPRPSPWKRGVRS